MEPALRQALRNLLDVDPYDLDAPSGGQEAVADTISIDDILDIRPDLTRKQAWELLKAVGDVPGYDHEVIRACALDLYGDAGTA
jgi:hypothetical protein